MTHSRLGFLINPVAGLGGAVGLHGSDGPLAREARRLGAVPLAGERARAALAALLEYGGTRPELLTAAGAMGAEVALSLGLSPRVVASPPGRRTTAADTRRAAAALLEAGIDLLLFAGGDGTARDLLAAVGRRVPLLGVPCGVKMHSAVFAASARAAGDVTRSFLKAPRPADLLRDAEIMDRAPAAVGGAQSPALFGFVRTPRVAQLVAPAKGAAGGGELLAGACRQAAERIRAEGGLWLLGPGTTLQRVKAELGFEGSLLGVDARTGAGTVYRNLGERRLLHLLGGRPAHVLVGVVGGQGFLFGRGNQPLSPAVLRVAGLENIRVIAAQEKLSALPASQLWVDTGDEALDAALAGYRPVLTGRGRQTIMRVAAAGAGPRSGPPPPCAALPSGLHPPD